MEYSRGTRTAGTTKFPLKKMTSFAWDGITSFSVKPLRMVLYLGLGISAKIALWKIATTMIALVPVNAL